MCQAFYHILRSIKTRFTQGRLFYTQGPFFCTLGPLFCALVREEAIFAICKRCANEGFACMCKEIVHYDTSAMKRFLTSVSLQHEPKASDVITLVKKTFIHTSIVRNFISRGVKIRISSYFIWRCAEFDFELSNSNLTSLIWLQIIEVPTESSRNGLMLRVPLRGSTLLKVFMTRQ